MQNHYPAIDIPASISRVMSQIVSPQHLAAAGRFRTLLAKQNELKLLVELGEYKPGLNAESDKAVELTLPMRHFLCQSPAESVAADETGRLLEQLIQ